MQLVGQSLHADKHELEGVLAGPLQEQLQLVLGGGGLAAEEEEGLRDSLVDVDDEGHQLAGGEAVTAMEDRAGLGGEGASKLSVGVTNVEGISSHLVLLEQLEHEGAHYLHGGST